MKENTCNAVTSFFSSFNFGVVYPFFGFAIETINPIGKTAILIVDIGESSLEPLSFNQPFSDFAV